MVESSKK